MFKKVSLSLVAALALTTATATANTVYATVDGEDITQADITMALSNSKVQFDTLSQDDKNRVITQLVEKKLLTKKAKQSDVQKLPAYQKALAKLKDDLALEIWMQEEFKKLSVSNKEIEDFYANNKQRFQKSEQLNARHILLDSKQDAQNIIKKLNQSKNTLKTFESLAKKHSTGPTGSKGGALGWFQKNQMVQPFSQAASNLSKGDYTKEPVETEYGFHVIYLEDKKPSQTASLKEASQQIKKALIQQKFQNKIKEVSQKMKQSAQITIK